MVIFSERDNVKKKAPRRWFLFGCGSCLRTRESSTLINNILHQDDQITPTQDTSDIPGEQTDKVIAKVPRRARSEGSLNRPEHYNSRLSLTDILNRTCINSKQYSSGLSVISKSDSCTCYLPPLERRKYTHQMVVVAPISGKFKTITVCVRNKSL